MTRIHRPWIFVTMAAAISTLFFSCKSHDRNASGAQKGKTAVLLVNHGSRSATWRNALIELENAVRDSILADGSIGDVKTAFMEYTEPSIATRLKEFDRAGYSDVVLVPVFLTVSSHSFDDIPTLIGQKDDPKSIELFKIEKMERYTPKAKVHMTPLLDFTDLLKKNVLRRFKELSKDPANEALTLIAYGDKTYNSEWTQLMRETGEYVKQNTGISDYSFGWCGHIAHYNPDSTAVAVQQALDRKKRSIVIPVLVAFDETFQVKIIGGGINKVENPKERVAYRPDAILPDKDLEHWVIDASRKMSNEVKGLTAKAH